MRKKLTVMIASSCLTALFALPVMADDLTKDAIIGGAVGGALGGAIGAQTGDRNTAILGSAVGAAVGTAVATDGDDEARHSRENYQDDHYYHDDHGGKQYKNKSAAGFCPPGQAKKGNCNDHHH